MDEHKEVEYQGLIYTVPTWARYIAADCDGFVYAYSHKPEVDRLDGVYTCVQGECQPVDEVKPLPPLKEI